MKQPKNLYLQQLQNARCFALLSMTSMRLPATAIYGSGSIVNRRSLINFSEVLNMISTTFHSVSTAESIRFAIGECSLGSILVAATGQGVCAILLGDGPGPLVRELQGRFPKALPIGENRDFEQLVAKVVGFIEAPSLGLDLPLDMQGTAFQRRVWQALRAIPVGQTVSYAEIAERIGVPKGAYAVGQACASNVIAVAIPCHRVVCKNGALAGYRWGIERKRALLQREARA
jgi:AraC family transcriptional regulator, regulatory protein of adaptative response / methylated-DNA-[protein]-cysteine methyltransferase